MVPRNGDRPPCRLIEQLSRGVKVGDAIVQTVDSGAPEYRKMLVAQYMATLHYGSRKPATIQKFLEREHGVRVSTSTISNDMREVREEWQRNRTENFERIAEMELGRLDALESEVWHAWRNSGKEKEDVTTTEEAVFVSVGSDSVPAKLIRTTKVRYTKDPDPRYAATILAIQEARRRLILGPVQEANKEQGDTTKDVTFAVTLRIGKKLTASQSSPVKELPAEFEMDDRKVIDISGTN